MTAPYWTNGIATLYHADAREIPLPDKSVHCCVTSPPYFSLRDYALGDTGIGLEPTLAEWLASIVAVSREVWRVLRDDGTYWLNLGDSYAGSGKGMNADGTHSDGEKQASNRGSLNPGKRTPRGPGSGRWGLGDTNVDGLPAKNLMGQPWRAAFALQDMGWVLRSAIVWAKPNPMPESVKDRPTTAHEYVFLLSKSTRYFYDGDAIREPLADSSLARISQPSFMRQTGGDKDYGNGTNPNRSARRALENLAAKQRGHARPHEGFNDLWDAMPKAEQQSNGANARTVWTIATQGYSGAHFATFPEDLPRRCILAGTSEHGVCGECGAPWRRVVEKIATGVTRRRERGGIGTHHKELTGHKPTSGDFQEGVQTQTVGWQPGCECNTARIPATVLDPFVGSGTTVAVAQSLGRKGIGLDLNPDYLAIARKRLEGITLPLPIGAWE